MADFKEIVNGKITSRRRQVASLFNFCFSFITLKLRVE